MDGSTGVTELSNSPAERRYLFGPFQLLPVQQLLLNGSETVRIGKRSIAILTALIERAGELVTKKELLAIAWPRRVVEDGNLKVAVASLRRALGESRTGDRYVENVPGRGYRFVAPVTCREARNATGRAPGLAARPLPRPTARVIGRAGLVASLAATLPKGRLLSLVGPGGIGKTTVALTIAEALADQLEHGACFIDLASLVDARFVPMAMAQALGVSSHSDNAVPALVGALRERRVLLVIDSCEHVLTATAALIDEVLTATSNVLVLATSREPLNVRRETIHRLGPLATPLITAGLAAADAMKFSAVELFVERASARLPGFRLTDSEAPAVAEICRKLEGVALAIELAATRVDTFTLPELSSLLDNQLRVLSLDQRGTLARHGSLAAALDWSHALLTEYERTVLYRLSVFAGPFTLAAAQAMGNPDCDITTALANLVAKSMVSANVVGAIAWYRLPDTTRAYAAQKLVDSGESVDACRIHADYFVGVLTRAEQASLQRPGSDWLADHSRCIDDVRKALAWAFSAQGNRALGIELTIAAIPLWMQLSLLDECRSNVESALALDLPDAPLTARQRMSLLAAYGMALLYARGPQQNIAEHWTEALELAQQADDVRCQMHMLWGLSCYLIFVGECRGALGLLRKLRNVARRRGDIEDRLSAERLLATTLHYFGGQQRARERLEAVLQNYAGPAQQLHIARFQVDQRGAARGTLANILWLQGCAEQAERTAREALEDARAAAHPISLCYLLGFVALPIALYNGDLAAAEGYLKQLHEHVAQNAFPIWTSLSECLEATLMIERGDPTGVARLQEAHDRLLSANFRFRESYFLCALARGHAQAGRLARALGMIDRAIASCERSGERHALPEALRLKGEFLRATGSGQALREAARLFRRSIHQSRRYGALAWELRAVMNQAELYRDLDRHSEAAWQLAAVRSCFTEGFETADLQRASALMSTIDRRIPPRPNSS